jgi:ubiquinol-cytochrome c reductase iron-sulfur subunit
LGSVDHGYMVNRIDRVAEPERRAFMYMTLSSIRFVWASYARMVVVKFMGYMMPSAEVLAQAFGEFDVSEIEEGTSMLVMWRGKPVFIKRRTPEEIATEIAVPMDHLRDQERDEDRRIKPEIVAVLGICPHLGCVPVADAGDYGGWFCPCHGSHYDTSGRIRKGPSPLNLEIPPYKFISDTEILMG